MRITSLRLEGFRAFDETFKLDLEGGKNLLLHGENGSGKSSIYLALRRFFEELGCPIGGFRNLYSPDSRSTKVCVHLKGIDSAGEPWDDEVTWTGTEEHPLIPPDDIFEDIFGSAVRSSMVDGARRSGFLDYRSMLRIHLISRPLSRSKREQAHFAPYPPPADGLPEQLFDVVTHVALAGVRVTIQGGTVTTIGRLIRNVWRHRPHGRYKNVLQKAHVNAIIFNQAINAILPELETQLNEYLSYFSDLYLSVKLEPLALAWDKPSLSLMGAVFRPEITFRGRVVTDPQEFMNEARLSAIATCLFLAGVRLSDNDYANPIHPRFLVLDDALIGLELGNRLPVLNILTSDHFKNYQIILMTHDQVWFDLARGHLPDNWIHKSLLANEETGHLVPICKPCRADLDTARLHLDNGDLKAAAVYARSAFEWKLHKVCEKNGIKTPFKADPKDYKAGALWDAIVERQRERETARNNGSVVKDFISPVLETKVATLRSTVLNKLNHAGSAGLVKTEVRTAIDAVADLIAHTFPNAT